MSFFNDFIDLMTLYETEEIKNESKYHSSQLDYQNRQLEKIQEFNEREQARLEIQREIKNYIFEISERLKKLNKNVKKTSPEYCVKLYFLMKAFYESEISTNDLDEIKDKSYLSELNEDFENSVKSIENSNENISELNQLISNIERRIMLEVEYESEKETLRLKRINEQNEKFKIKQDKQNRKLATGFVTFLLTVVFVLVSMIEDNTHTQKIFFLFIGVFSAIVGFVLCLKPENVQGNIEEEKKEIAITKKDDEDDRVIELKSKLDETISLIHKYLPEEVYEQILDDYQNCQFGSDEE